MDYCKITTTGQAQRMPNPLKVTIANPTEEQKATLAPMLGYLPMRYTPEPEYDPDTQYTECHWEEQDGWAVQIWEVKDKPTPPPEPEQNSEDNE